MRSTWLVSFAAAVIAVPSAAAQIAVTPIRNLAFGPVIVGIPTAIGPSHPTRSGQLRVTAPLGTRVRFRFTLPARLDGPAGATMPITFNNNDAIAVGAGPGGVPETFNPKAQQVDRVIDGAINVFLGGRVSPAANQPLGNYSGTITLTVTVQ